MTRGVTQHISERATASGRTDGREDEDTDNGTDTTAVDDDNDDIVSVRGLFSAEVPNSLIRGSAQ